MTHFGSSRTERAARELFAVMERELDLARKMLALAGAQSDALAAHDMARLMATTDQVRTLTARQEELEHLRQAAVSGFVAEGICAQPTAAELAEQLPSAERIRLLALRTELLDVEHALTALTNRNHRLLENAQDVARTSLDLLVRIATAPARYGANPDAMRTPTLYLDQRA
jgi:hypothetical protein